MASVHTTKECFDLARRGDEGAYDELFARVGGRVLVYIRLQLGSKLALRTDPEDVLQETYLEAHKSFSSLKATQPGGFVRWLYRIADNRISNLSNYHAAKKRCRPEARFSEVLDRVRLEATGPGTAFDRGDLERRLGEALQELEDDARQALLLRHFHDHTLEEIAKTLDRSEAAVRRLLLRSRLKLGFLLKELSAPL